MELAKNRALTGAVLAFFVAFALVTSLLPDRITASAPSLDLPKGALEMEAKSAALPDAPRTPSPAITETEREEPAHEVVAPSESRPTSTRSEPTPIGSVLHGTITSSEGGVLEGASVWLTHVDGEFYRAEANSKGHYSLGPLPTGTHLITAGTTDFHRIEADIELPPETPLVQRDFVLHPQQVVRVDLVTSTGEPALAALREAKLSVWGLNLVPVATRSDPGETFTEVTGSLNNTFGIGGFWQAGMMGRPAQGPATYGTVTLGEDGPAWISLVAAHQVLRKRQIDPSVREVVFTLDPEDIKGLYCEVFARAVATEDGTPLSCQASLEDDPFSMHRGLVVEDDGLLHLEGQLPGDRWLILQAQGRAPLVKRVTLVRGQALDLGDLELHVPVELSGEVRTESGDPIEAVLRWGEYDPATQKVSWHQQSSRQSKPDGSFSIGNLNPGHWLVQAEGLPAAGARHRDPSLVSFPMHADASLGSVEGIELVMIATTVITFAVEGAGDPWPSAIVHDSRGLRTAGVWLGRWGKESQMHLPPGSYELILRRDGEETDRRDLLVGSEPQRIELTYE